MSPGLLVRLLAAASLTACSATQVRYRPTPVPPPAAGGAAAVLYLVGDGGEVNAEREAVLEALAADVARVARGGAGPPVVVAFLGDNIYDEGAPSDPGEDDVEKLAGQIRALGAAPNVVGIFVPGNHDWANGASLDDGRAAIARQREWIAEMSEGRDVRLLPADGCPGPATAELGGVAQLVLIDTEWLLRSPEGECGAAADFYARLADALREHRDRMVILLSHHPLVSGGPHGGNVAPFDRGPLVYYMAVKSGVLRQDIGSRAYTAMTRGILEAIAVSGAPPLVHAAGHDHTLQVIRMAGSAEPRYQLVSGALAKSESVRRVDGTRYATNGFGFMRLDLVRDEARVLVFMRERGGGPVRPVFSCTLTGAAPVSECPEAPREAVAR